jgi:hypothetical protein
MGIPRAVALQDGLVWVVGGHGTDIGIFSASGELIRTVESPDAIVAVASHHQTVLAVSTTAVYQFDPPSGTLTALGEAHGQEEIRAVAVNSTSMWLLTSQGARDRLSRYQWSNHQGLSAPEWTIEVDQLSGIVPIGMGAVLVSRKREPHSVLAIDSMGSLHSIGKPTKKLTARSLREGANGQFSLSALPISCRHAVQVITDLHSNRRTLILYDMSRRRLLRAIHVDTPMGITAVDASSDLVLGAIASGGKAEIVVYRWNWTRDMRRKL